MGARNRALNSRSKPLIPKPETLNHYTFTRIDDVGIHSDGSGAATQTLNPKP
jgi:hypothetical protein